MPEFAWALLTAVTRFSGSLTLSRTKFFAVRSRRAFLLARHICIHFYFQHLEKRHAICVHLFGTYPTATKQLN
jgi:hypothetical protein